MINLKLDFDDEMEEPYTLVAIHCSEEEYKLAYLLNLHLGMKLTRRAVDIDFSTKDGLATFPLYDYEDAYQYTKYYMVANRCRFEGAIVEGSSGLFSTLASERARTQYLLPEFKKVDYFLKIFSDFETVPLRKIVSEINEIKQVISAYTLQVDRIKSKNNLIFD